MNSQRAQSSDADSWMMSVPPPKGSVIESAKSFPISGTEVVIGFFCLLILYRIYARHRVPDSLDRNRQSPPAPLPDEDNPFV